MASEIPYRLNGLVANTLGQTQNSSAFPWRGGAGYVVAAGTLSAGTLSVEYSPDEEITWLKTGSELTAVGIDRFEAPPGRLRLNLVGTTADIDCWVGPVPPYSL